MLHHKPADLINLKYSKRDRYGKCSKISNNFLFLFSTKMLVTRDGIHKMLVKIANSRTLLGLSRVFCSKFYNIYRMSFRKSYKYSVLITLHMVIYDN